MHRWNFLYEAMFENAQVTIILALELPQSYSCVDEEEIIFSLFDFYIYALTIQMSLSVIPFPHDEVVFLETHIRPSFILTKKLKII